MRSLRRWPDFSRYTYEQGHLQMAALLGSRRYTAAGTGRALPGSQKMGKRGAIALAAELGSVMRGA